MTTEIEVAANRSKTYLLPLLDEIVGLDFVGHIQNTYLKFSPDLNIQSHYPFGILYKYDTSIYYREGKRVSFPDWETSLKEHPLLEKVFDFGVNTLYVFDFPKEYLTEYKLFKLGKYSKFSNAAKTVILEKTSLYYKHSSIAVDVAHVLYKNKERKRKLELELGIKLPDDCELASKFDSNEELFEYTGN